MKLKAANNRFRCVYKASAQTIPETTHYIPLTNENLAELDWYSRIERASLFAGSDRIGFKCKTNTALYVKDHLGPLK